MQSDTFTDTFIPDTDSDDELSEYESDSSGDLPKNNNIGVMYDFPKNSITDQRFMDQSSQQKYSELRNELFTPKLIKGRILFHTHSSGSHKSIIDLVDDYKLNGLDNVIGFELIKAHIKSGDSSKLFVDILLSELPHICCKQTEQGIPVLERVQLNPDTTTYTNHLQDRNYNNYFTPTKLSKLTLKTLYNGDKDSVAELEGFYEFEITILNRSLSHR